MTAPEPIPLSFAIFTLFLIVAPMPIEQWGPTVAFPAISTCEAMKQCSLTVVRWLDTLPVHKF